MLVTPAAHANLQKMLKVFKFMQVMREVNSLV